MSKENKKIDHEQLVADLAWDFCQRSRSGQKVSMREYLKQCPDAKTRADLKTLINTGALLRIARQTQQSKR